MGANQSSAAKVSQVKSSPIRSNDENKPSKTNSKVLDTPIFMDESEQRQEQEQEQGQGQHQRKNSFPTPTGNEYDLMDKIAAELPSIIDDESKRQVEDYKQACDNGKGPMVACFATAEFLSLFERKHKEAFELYKNTCFRPKSDKSPNGVPVDGTRAYPPGCFNLAQMHMTGKGGVPFDRLEGYKLFDRACRGGHGGACHFQAKMLLSDPGALGRGIPYNPHKAADLLEKVCHNGDSISCFTLATMLLRGDRVNAEATNVTPDEARGKESVKVRTHEQDRSKGEDDKRTSLPRDPPRAEKLLSQACLTSGHAPSCFNLAVMYTNGDDGVDADPEKARKFQQKTEEMVDRFGGLGGM